MKDGILRTVLATAMSAVVALTSTPVVPADFYFRFKPFPIGNENGNGNGNGGVGQTESSTLTLSAPGPATVGQAFTVGMAVSGSTPAGFRLSPAVAGLSATASGISGTPSAVGSHSVRVEALDASNAVIGTSNSRTINVHDPITVTAPAAGSYVAGSGFPSSGTKVDATGGNGSYTYSISGGPAWLTIDSGTGQLGSSSPSLPPTPSTTVTVQVRDTDNRSAAATWNVRVAAGPVTATIPSNLTLTEGDTFPGGAITAAGGDGSYTYSLTGAPAWLTVDSDGLLVSATSTPPATPLTTVTARVDDTSGGYAEGTFTVEIAANPVVATVPGNFSLTEDGAFPGGTITATGGSGTYTYSLSGAPAWLSVSAAEGVLSSSDDTLPVTPLQTVTARVEDTAGKFDEKTFTVEVTAASTGGETGGGTGGGGGGGGGAGVDPVSVAAIPSVSIMEGDEFPLLTIAPSGGDGTYTYTLSGAPAWMTVNASGIIASSQAHPPATPSASVTVEVRDSASRLGTQQFSVEVKPVTITLAAATLPPATRGQAWNHDFKNVATVSGVTVNDLSWSLDPATKPSWMAINAASGAASGTPGTTGSNSFDVVASYKTKDGRRAYTVTVQDVVLDVVQIAAGDMHTCALTTSGGVKCWGSGSYGQLGDGGTTQRNTPVDAVGLTSGVRSVIVGLNHSCAVTNPGAVKCWGSNASGQIGDGSTTQRNAPADVTGLGSGVISIAAGNEHTCVSHNGVAKCWGSNASGQLGNGNTGTNSSTPVAVTGLWNTQAVELGETHSCALTTSGGMKCWGSGSNGQLGNNATASSNVPVDVAGLASGVAGITAGGTNTCARTTGGAAKCWGYGAYGQIGDGMASQRNAPTDVTGLTSGITAIASGKYHTCVIHNGAAKCWGRNNRGQVGDNTTTQRYGATQVSGLASGVSAITAGSGHTCAVVSSNTMKCWGDNIFGQLGNNSTTQSNVPVDVYGTAPEAATLVVAAPGAATVGQAYSVGMTVSGSPVASYRLTTAVPGLTASGTGITGTPTTAGSYTTAVEALNASSQVIGTSNTVTIDVRNGVATTTAGNITLDEGDTFPAGRAITATGGNGSLTYSLSGHPSWLVINASTGVLSSNVANPPVTALTTVTARAQDTAGRFDQKTFTVEVRGVTITLAAATLPTATVGQAWSFDFKTLATVTGASMSDLAWAKQGASAPSWLTVDAANGTASGTPSASGSATFDVVASYTTKVGQQAYTIVVNGNILQVTQISAGNTHTCAVTTAGGVKCWGMGLDGQLGNGANANSDVPVDVVGLTSGVKQVATFSGVGCAVTSANGVKCWGANNHGQLGNGTVSTSINTPVDVSGLTSGVSKLAAGGTGTPCALTTGGAVKCWGSNTYGQLGNNTTTHSSTPVTPIASGATAVGVGGYHACAIVSGGAVRCWGYNTKLQLGSTNSGQATSKLVPTASGVTTGGVSLALGFEHSCVLTSGGGVRCWGAGDRSQLGNGTTTASTATPVNVTGLTSGVAQIGGGGSTVCAVTTAGAAKCWGDNSYGQVGDGTTINRSAPVDVSGLGSGVASITSTYHTCAMMTSGGAKCWGTGSYGRLGDGAGITTGSGLNRSTPGDVRG